MLEDNGLNGIKADKALTPSGFWGRAENGRDYAKPKAKELSREDYGATAHGGKEEPDRPKAGERNPLQANDGEPCSATIRIRLFATIRRT